MLFVVHVEGVPDLYRWYVRSQKLLRQIKGLGETLTDITVEVIRKGEGLETDWELIEINQ